MVLLAYEHAVMAREGGHAQSCARQIHRSGRTAEAVRKAVEVKERMTDARDHLHSIELRPTLHSRYSQLQSHTMLLLPRMFSSRDMNP